jgi:energy-coupling factor transporter transmembrane protein EcfT
MPNTLTWVLWLALAFTYSMITYHPLYLTLLFITLSILTLKKQQPLKTYVKLGLLVSIIPLTVNFFLVHSGDTVILRIPRHIPLSGFMLPTLFLAGPITLESVSMGVLMALLLVDMLTAFQLFNSQTTADELINIMPSSFTGISMTALISLRFIPTVTNDFQSIRDAQLSKGYRFTSGAIIERMRNNVSLLVPTLITSLERGFNLSESMAARAYSRRRTRYKTVKWHMEDKIMSAAYIASIPLLIYLKYEGSLYFWPYDSLQLPPLNLLALIPMIALALPVLTENGERG